MPHLATKFEVCKKRAQPIVMEEYGDDKLWLPGLQIESTGILTPLNSCMALVCIDGSSECNLVVADTCNNLSDTRHPIQTSLKTFRGHHLLNEHKVPAIPVSLIHFYPDAETTPRIPVIALGSGADVYMYHAHTPFQRFTLPFIRPNSEEYEIWQDLSTAAESVLVSVAEFLNPGKEAGGFVDEAIVEYSCSRLNDLRASGVQLAQRSLDLLSFASARERQQFVSDEATSPLLTQAEISCMGVLNRNSESYDAQGMIVIGTEEGMLYIVSPPGYSIIETFKLHHAISQISILGSYERGFAIAVICRDGGFYIISRYSSRYFKGTFDFKLRFQSPITCIQELRDHEKGFTGFAVALSNRENPIYALRFGKFGRDGGSLVMIGSQGELDIRILRRHCDLNTAPEVNQSQNRHSFDGSNTPEPVEQPLPIARKTRLYLETIKNERENAKAIYENLQHDLMRLRLLAAKTSFSLNQNNANPVSQKTMLKVDCHIKGMGPTWRIYVTVTNTGDGDSPPTLLMITADPELYRIEYGGIEIPPLSPRHSTNRSTFLHARDDSSLVCSSENGVAESIAKDAFDIATDKAPGAYFESSTDGHKIYYRIWKSYFQKYTQAGILVRSMDWRGHGRTLKSNKDGVPGYCGSFLQVHLDMLQLYNIDVEGVPKSLPTFAYGQSMGGLLALLFAKNHGSKIQNLSGVISQSPAIKAGAPPSAPVLWAVRSLGSFVPKVTQPNELDIMGINSSEDRIVEYLKDPLNHGLISVQLAKDMFDGIDEITAAAGDFKFPLIMYHNQSDRLTIATGSSELFSKIGSSDKKYFEFAADLKLGHELHNESTVQQSIISDYTTWIFERCSTASKL
ncbi:ciliary BBSome complex subunit 1-domain-containing protein [Obelidium mucronatum]|nr:ciliary BBSome complex subunit 1-domain-containing protein [Obelidium mucronatum]